MAMILDRTMMFGFTLRSDIPIKSTRPTRASENLAWIQRLKYLATRTNRRSRTSTMTAMNAITRTWVPDVWAWARSAGIMGKVPQGGVGGGRGAAVPGLGIAQGVVGRGSDHQASRASLHGHDQ